MFHITLQQLSLNFCSTIATNEYMDWLCMTRLQSHNIASDYHIWVGCMFRPINFLLGVGILGQSKMLGLCWPWQDNSRMWGNSSNLHILCMLERVRQHSRLPCDHSESKRWHLQNGKLALLDMLANICSEQALFNGHTIISLLLVLPTFGISFPVFRPVYNPF